MLPLNGRSVTFSSRRQGVGCRSGLQLVKFSIHARKCTVMDFHLLCTFIILLLTIFHDFACESYCFVLPSLLSINIVYAVFNFKK